jgi:hypothetical protein
METVHDSPKGSRQVQPHHPIPEPSAVDDDLSFLGSAVVEFPGYGDEIVRRGTDQRVRALLGEALSALRARLDGALDGGLSARLDVVVLRCQFVDQRYVAAIESRKIGTGDIALLARTDRELVESACGLATLEAAALAARLDEIAGLLDRRSAPFG